MWVWCIIFLDWHMVNNFGSPEKWDRDNITKITDFSWETIASLVVTFILPCSLVWIYLDVHCRFCRYAVLQIKYKDTDLSWLVWIYLDFHCRFGVLYIKKEDTDLYWLVWIYFDFHCRFEVLSIKKEDTDLSWVVLIYLDFHCRFGILYIKKKKILIYLDLYEPILTSIADLVFCI